MREGLPRLAPEKALSHLANDAYMEEGESHNQIAAIHFGMILCISNVIGTMTPPVAVNIFSAVQVTRSVRELKIGEISKAEIPFFIGYVAVFFLCVFSETFCTFLIR